MGFAIDIYGKGRRANNPEEGSVLMGELNNNRALLLQTMQLAITCAKDFEWADSNKIGAIGFCFGGKCVLDLARSGENFNGAVTFHGVYDQPDIKHTQTIKPSILILHGWDDPLALPQDTIALAKELTDRKADWEINAYGNTGHAFTNPNAQSVENGMFFNKKSDEKAWKRMVSFFQDIF